MQGFTLFSCGREEYTGNFDSTSEQQTHFTRKLDLLYNTLERRKILTRGKPMMQVCKTLSMLIPAGVHKRLKLAAVEENKTITEIVAALILKYLDKREKQS